LIPRGALRFVASGLHCPTANKGSGNDDHGNRFELHKSVELPSRYRLVAKWETLENHTVDFRGSADFAEWRALVGPYFETPPYVEHTETVLTT